MLTKMAIYNRKSQSINIQYQKMFMSPIVLLAYDNCNKSWFSLCIFNKGKHIVNLRNCIINTSELCVIQLPCWHNSALKSATWLRSRVLRLTEASSLGPDLPQTSPRNETVPSFPIKWPSEHDETIHDTVTWNQRYFAFILPRVPLVYKYHVMS